MEAHLVQKDNPIYLETNWRLSYAGMVDTAEVAEHANHITVRIHVTSRHTARDKNVLRVLPDAEVLKSSQDFLLIKLPKDMYTWGPATDDIGRPYPTTI